MSEPSSSPGMLSTLQKVYAWLARKHLVLILTVLVVVAGAWGFIELADKVMEGDTKAFDEAILRALRRGEDLGQPVGPPWIRQAARDLTALGSVAVLFIFTLAAAGFLLLARRYGEFVLVLTATWGGQLVCLMLKSSLNRERPQVVPHWDEVATASFPSGHAMMAAVVYLTLSVTLANFLHGRRLKTYIVSIALILTFLVGVSRVILGVHYPTDVLAGWTAGLVWAMLCGWLAGFFSRRRKKIPLSPQTISD